MPKSRMGKGLRMPGRGKGKRPRREKGQRPIMGKGHRLSSRVKGRGQEWGRGRGCQEIQSCRQCKEGGKERGCKSGYY